VHIYYDQIGFVLDLWLKFLLRSCEEDLAAAAVKEREKHFCEKIETHIAEKIQHINAAIESKNSLSLGFVSWMG